MPAIINQDIETRQIKDGIFKNTGLDKKGLVQRANALKTEGSTWISTFKDLQTYVYPTKGFFNQTSPNQGTKIDHKTLIEEEATICVDTFAAGMTSGLTSPSKPWFELFLEDQALMEIHRVKFWLDVVRDNMLDIYQKSNTYPTLTSMYKELSIFATACALVEEDFYNVIHLFSFTAGEYFLGGNHKGIINAFYHRFWMQAGQMADFFGIENCSVKVQELYKQNNPDTWIIVNHLIEENNDRIPFLKDFRNMPYRCAYWEDGEEDDSYLKLGGYEEWPLITPRWETTTMADAYGKGPGWKALGAIKELQKKTKNLLIGLDKGTNPPLQADATIVGDVNTLPGGITRSSALTPNTGVRSAYEVKLDLAALDLSIEKTKQKIRKFFFSDLFTMLIEADRQGKPLTATEVMARQSEKLSLLGPILERWQGDDFLKSFITRTFNIGTRLFIFPPPPPELRGREIKIRYVSVLAQAQRMAEASLIDTWINSIITLAQVNPNIIDIINFDEYAKEKGRIFGVPAKIINSPEAVAMIRQAKQKLAVEQATREKMMMMADAMQKGAGAVNAMGNTPMDENTALDKTLKSMEEVRKGQR